MSSHRYHRSNHRTIISLIVPFVIFNVALSESDSVTNNRNLRHKNRERRRDDTFLEDYNVDDRNEQDEQKRSLIIGGTNARNGHYPYFAHFSPPECGGTLIAPNLVLTAGHVSKLILIFVHFPKGLFLD